MSVLTQLLAKSTAKRVGERLYQAAVRQARSTAFYASMGVADTVEGRFEMMTLHVILLVDRLKDAAAPADAVRQSLFDSYVSNLDGALREMGVGDLAVGKHMRKLGEAFYGRAQAFDSAFASLPDREALDGILARTATLASERDAGALGDYVVGCRSLLARADVATLLAGEPAWPAP